MAKIKLPGPLIIPVENVSDEAYERGDKDWDEYIKQLEECKGNSDRIAMVKRGCIYDSEGTFLGFNPFPPDPYSFTEDEDDS